MDVIMKEKCLALILIFSLNNLDHIYEAKIQKDRSTKAEDKVVAPAI